MTVTNEEGGKLNAFAREPKIEVIDQKTSDGKNSWIIITVGALLFGCLIAVTISIS